MVMTRSSQGADNDRNVAQDNNPDQHTEQGDGENVHTRTEHTLQDEVNLSNYNSGLKLIPDFTGNNWDEFKRKLELQFIIMGIDTYLTHPPNSHMRHEVRNDKLASAQIHLRLPQAQYKQVSTCKTTVEIWTRLKEIYEQTAAAKADNLFMQFIHHKKLPTQSMKQYLDKIIELYHDLRVYDIQLTELAICTKALDRLPETYNQIKTAARASQVSTIPRLTNLLMTAAREGSAIKVTEPELKNLHTEYRQTNKTRRFKKSTKHCTRCNRSTHTNEECWVLHPELRSKNEQQRRNGQMTSNSAFLKQQTKDDVDASFTGYHTETTKDTPQHGYLIDSGANASMTNNKNILHDYEKLGKPLQIVSSNGKTSPAYGKGKLRLNGNPSIVINNVLFVPQITKTLIATRSITDLGLTVVIKDKLFVMNSQGETIITAQKKNGLHFIDDTQQISTYSSIALDLAHKRFGHASDERLKHITETTDGITITNKERAFCNECAQGKSRRQPFPSERKSKPRREFEIISSDLKGPMLTPSKEGYRYYVTFNCLYSKWCWLTFLKHKTADEVLDALKRFITDAQAETNLRMTSFLTDNGAEYVNSQMETFNLQKNIKHQRTVPHSPQQNGFAERQNLTIMSMARCLLIASNLPNEYWPFAVRYAVYTLNRLPTKEISWKTPYQIWFKRKPDVSYMRPFGCIAYANIEKSLRSSLEPTSVKCTLLGYAQYQKGYILERYDDKKIIINRDVIFDETTIRREDRQAEIQEDPDPMAIVNEYEANNATTKCPDTYSEAMQHPEANAWHQAALDEMKSHKDNETWTLTQVPPGTKAIKGRWIFTYKRDPTGDITHKARPVAKGYSQRYGIDYEDTYSSVLTYTSLRIIVCIAINKGWKIHQKDFKTAYLNAPLLTPIYIEQPDGFVHNGREKHVCLLNKALYGLKQAGRAWQQALFKHEAKDTTILGIYVDDILITGSDENEINRISTTMSRNFKMKDIGELQEFLGIQAIYSKGEITLTQAKYAQELISKYGQEHSKSVRVPMPKPYDPTSDDKAMDIYPIRQAIGGLMYLTNTTRPDIAFAVNNISRHVTRQTKTLWTTIQKIIKYLASTRNIGIVYRKSNFKIECWADSDYANDIQDRKSITGWIVNLGSNIISWKSKKQPSVALSSTEAEYMAASDAIKEVIWLQDLLEELQLRKEKLTTVIHQDNQGAIFLEKNHTNKQRTKHIDVRYHFTTRFYMKGHVRL